MLISAFCKNSFNFGILTQLQIKYLHMLLPVEILLNHESSQTRIILSRRELYVSVVQCHKMLSHSQPDAHNLCQIYAWRNPEETYPWSFMNGKQALKNRSISSPPKHARGCGAHLGVAVRALTPATLTRAHSSHCGNMWSGNSTVLTKTVITWHPKVVVLMLMLEKIVMWPVSIDAVPQSPEKSVISLDWRYTRSQMMQITFVFSEIRHNVYRELNSFVLLYAIKPGAFFQIAYGVCSDYLTLTSFASGSKKNYIIFTYTHLFVESQSYSKIFLFQQGSKILVLQIIYRTHNTISTMTLREEQDWYFWVNVLLCLLWAYVLFCYDRLFDAGMFVEATAV